MHKMVLAGAAAAALFVSAQALAAPWDADAGTLALLHVPASWVTSPEDVARMLGATSYACSPLPNVEHTCAMIMGYPDGSYITVELTQFTPPGALPWSGWLIDRVGETHR